jgi:hypothetical protein
MKLELPEPLPIPWLCKPVESAASGMEILEDGRIYCWIEHETVRGVTPEMLVWWFSHLEGDVEVDGVRYDRYRVWHPRDHLFAEYAKRSANGTVGVGSVIHLAEMFDANPKYLIHIYTEIKKLDETGYEHHPRMHGLKLAKMEYFFEPADGGTKYRNSLTIGFEGWRGRLLNPIIKKLFFDEKRGRAWLKHNIEEVGNFEFFLPALFAAETKKNRVQAVTA